MKISKLFHWLYAVLMFLPIIVFIPNAFYYGFNKEATAQTRIVDEPVYYDTNEVNGVEDVVIGNVYRIVYPHNIENSMIKCDFLEVISYSSKGVAQTTSVFNYYRIESFSSTKEQIIFKSENGNPSQYINYEDLVADIIINEITSNANFIASCLYECPTKYVKNYQQVEYSMSIADSMAFAFDSTMQNDLFSWSYTSFLAEPFKYIGNIFGLPLDNPMYYLFSYWLDISIIWLIFDLIMYVPLLTHRWLDKGIVE